MAIEDLDKPILKALKREDVEKTLEGLGRFMTKSSWLGLQNRYASDTIRIIGNDVRVGQVHSPVQLSEFIVASCLLHCGDGWSYLGKSISALLRGDPHRARHLAYYAELRAAAALLATEGIGVFNTDHFAITKPNFVSELGTKNGTHNFAWDCLEFWADQTSSANLFANIIRPYGISLENWCVPLGGAATFAPHARKWFKQWGMDLRVFQDDHRARNISSYQPDGLPKFWSIDAHQSIEFVKSIWEALEPSPACRFDTIDSHLLRVTLEGYFKARTAKKAEKARAKFKAFARPVVEHQGLSDEASKQWLSFMCREVNPKDLDIFKYSQKLPDDMAFSAFAVMSRATLLLRAASGSTAQLFQAANHSIDSFKFWWENVGLSKGLWEGSKDPSELQDLWIDIRDSLTDIESFQSKYPPAKQTYFRMGEDVARAVLSLGSCERVALWSMTS